MRSWCRSSSLACSPENTRPVKRCRRCRSTPSHHSVTSMPCLLRFPQPRRIMIHRQYPCLSSIARWDCSARTTSAARRSISQFSAQDRRSMRAVVSQCGQGAGDGLQLGGGQVRAEGHTAAQGGPALQGQHGRYRPRSRGTKSRQMTAHAGGSQGFPCSSQRRRRRRGKCRNHS